MDKAELLGEVRRLAAAGQVTAAELAEACRDVRRPDPDGALAQPAGMSGILLYIGAAIVVLGIAVLIGQHWTQLNDATRVLATLGSGIAAYAAGVLLGRDGRRAAVGAGMYLISGLVMPLGLHVTFDVAGFDIDGLGMQTLISALLWGMYFATYLADRRTQFLVFAVIFGTWLFFAATGFLVGPDPRYDWRFSAYRVLAAGASYLALARHFSQTPHRALSGWLYGFGAFTFLGAALALGEWKPHQNLLWELIFPGVAFGAMFLSIPWKSRALLTFGSLYLMAYLVKITSEYFAHSLGWPLALVLIGFGLIGVGYLHITLNRQRAAAV